ncbi:MAG: FHA domain-containing protein [Actinomycetota bacterium]
MPDQVLTALKVLLLALVYLFFARVLWAVWSEVRTPVAPRGGAPRERSPRRRKGAMAFVVIEPREERGHRFTLSSVLTIGRDDDCDIAMPADTFMSGHHARIEVRPGGAAVVDTNSTNGVFVNGKRVQGVRSLRDGDRIQAGNTVLETRG